MRATVREARRMVALRIFTQNDTRHAEGDARAVLHRDSIAIGDYGHSSHGTSHEGSRFGGKRHGEKGDLRKVDVPALQRRLHADGAATIYVGDVLTGHADFAAVQWWGGLGGLHGLAPRPTGSRLGKQIEGPHSEGWLNHSAGLAKPLDAPLAARWEKLARAAGITATLPTADGRATRGDFIRAAFVASR